MIFVRTVLIALLFFIASFPALANAQRPRVRIMDGTLKTDSGKLLRGATFFMGLYDIPDMRANEEKYRKYFGEIFEKRNLNCVRICPWIGNWEFDLANDEKQQREFLFALDKAVDWCEENNVYAIVNLHIAYNTKIDVEKAKAAWSVLAPRYKDRTHVIFELVNEPEPKSSLASMSQLYKHVRTLAPDTHIILFSHVAATQFSEQSLEKASEGIDYSNASVAFHCYDSVLNRATQWDHAQKLRALGYPIICTEFISLTNNNDMPISYEHLMHGIMRAEEREMAWISWGPFAQYHNVTKNGWTHEAIRYSPKFEQQLTEFSIDLDGSFSQLGNGEYLIQNILGDGYLTNPADSTWKKISLQPKPEKSAAWILKKVDGNIYRLESTRGENIYLQGNFRNEQQWQSVETAPLNNDWTSQKFQLRHVSDNIYRIKCLWGDLYLTGRNISDPDETENNIRMAPLNREWLSQQWRVIKQTPQIERRQSSDVQNPLRYLLYKPDAASTATTKIPLLLFLHGGGEGGDNLESIKRHGPPKLIEEGRSFPFYVVAPQNPSSTQFWDDQKLIALLDELEQELPIDGTRIYLTGLSRGAYGAWRLAIQNPDRFAAIVPIAGGGPLPYVTRLRQTPIWAFHGAKDKVIPASESERLIRKLEQADGKAKLTIYPDAAHDSWTATYENDEVWEWLLKQKRSP